MGVSNSQPWCGRRGHIEKGQPASPRGVGIGSSRVRPGPRNRPTQGRRVLRAAFAVPSSREQACTPTHRDEGLGAAENDWREGCQGRGVPVAAAWSVVVMWERGAGNMVVSEVFPRKCAEEPTLGQDCGWECCRPCRAKPAGIRANWIDSELPSAFQMRASISVRGLVPRPNLPDAADS